jgi:hypothetical protein
MPILLQSNVQFLAIVGIVVSRMNNKSRLDCYFVNSSSHALARNLPTSITMLLKIKRNMKGNCNERDQL